MLAAVKDKPFGRRGKRAFLDCHSARQPGDCAGRDEGWAPLGARTKDGPQEGRGKASRLGYPLQTARRLFVLSQVKPPADAGNVQLVAVSGKVRETEG